MRFGSVCSGIEAASAAWHSLGWRAQWFSEIGEFPSAVLAHHYSDVPNLGDMTRLHEKEVFSRSTIDLLIGGTPCQSFSLAGFRKGLVDPRGNLALVFLGIAQKKHPRWIVWENVPGVLSVADGRDFASFLSGLAQLGYGFCYRVLDSRYFGVAQSRRRVFVVGYLGDWRPAAAVLFESDSLRRDFAQEQRDAIEVEDRSGSYKPISFVWQSGFGSVSSREDICGTLIKNQVPAVYVDGCAPRILTPIECERLQGFTDDYTRVPYRGKSAEQCPTRPRYAVLGDSMAVPVIRWLGKKITEVDNVILSRYPDPS